MIDFHVMILPPNQRLLTVDQVPDEGDGIKTILSDDTDRAWVARTDPVQVIASMDAAGIETSVIMGWPWRSQERCVECNDYVADAITRFPGRFVGLAVVNPHAGHQATTELSRRLGSGFAGMKTKPEWQGFDLDDTPLLRPLFDLLIERSKLLMAHIAHPYQAPAGNHPHQLHNLLEEFPSLNVVASHMGGMYGLYYAHPPFQKRFDNLFFDLAFETFPIPLAGYLDLLPDGHIMFGSDHPFLSSEALQAKLATMNIPEHKRSSLIDGTARALLAKCGIDLGSTSS